MVGGVQPKILLTQDEDGNLKMDDQMSELFGFNPEWKLVRERDGLTKQSKAILWLEFNEDRTFKEKYDEIAVGRSLLMSPFNEFFTWQTTSVTEIVEQSEDHIKFKTTNSTYDLWRITE